MKKVFLYYTEEDADLAKAFRQHLNLLDEEAGLIELFDCAENGWGEDQSVLLKREIEQADIILLCMSVSIFNEERFKKEITPQIFAQYSKGKCLIMPVLLKKFLFSLTKFAKLKPAPSSGTPIDGYPNKDAGFTHVIEDLMAWVDQFESTIDEQKKLPEIDKIKLALENFNYYEQCAAPPLPLAPSPFSVLLIKGRQKSGHDLLGWRWREMAMPGLIPDIYTYHLNANPESAANIDLGLWNLIHQETGSSNIPQPLMPHLASKLALTLQERPLVVRFDHFEPGLHQTLVEDFLKALSNALQETKKQNPNLHPNQPLWFYILYRFEEEEVPFSLQFDAQLSLPTVKPVSENDFKTWQNSPAVQRFEVLDTCITIDYRKGEIIKPDSPENNEVLDVLDRICQSVYAKEDLFDKYIATKK